MDEHEVPPSTDWDKLAEALSINGSLDDLNRLIEEGIDVNIVDPYGTDYTPLHSAAMQDWNEFQDGRMKLLLESGADVHARANTMAGRPWTPLMLACFEGSVDQVIRLLQFKSDPNARDDIGRTPLILCMTNPSSYEIAIALIAAGAQTDARTDFGDTALSVLIEVRSVLENPEDNKWDWLELMLRNA